MFAQNQQNTLPTTGNVGVGTTTPDVKLQVNGRLRVDSSLLVKDSAVFEKRTYIKDRMATHFNTTSRHRNDPEGIQVYPNPSHGSVTVRFPKKGVGQYQVLNLQGKVIRQGAVHEERNVFHFSKGTYILKWIGKTSVQTKKIIVL